MDASRASPIKAAYVPIFMKGTRGFLSLFSILLLAAPVSFSHAEFARVGYINSASSAWENYTQLFDHTYTHIITTFLIPDGTGAIDPYDAAKPVVVEEGDNPFGIVLINRAQAQGSKVLVSIGGSTVSYKVYTDIASDPNAKANFIANVIDFVSTYDYDGVDANFEGWAGGTKAADRDIVDQLILDLAQNVKDACPGALFTVTLAPLYYLPASPSATVVNSDLIDMAHHMSYDFMSQKYPPNGPFRMPGSVLWLAWDEGTVERSVWGAFSYLYAKGYNLSKITGGIPFYLTDHSSWDSVRNDTDWSLVSLHASYLEKQHPADSRWVNDPEAIEAKIAEYKKIGLSGVMEWQVGKEGTTGDLSQALYDAATKQDPLVMPLTINFMPPLADCPGSYRRDSGGAYGLRGDYGWQSH